MSGFIRNAGQQKPKNPWNKSQNQKPAKQSGPKNSEDKFKEAQIKLQQAVQKYAKEYESSEEEEELEADGVIGTLLKNYNATGAQSDLIGRTKGFLEGAFLSGASTCLICISSIKRNESIWSCYECYCLFHLMCIQRWSKDTIFQQKQELQEQIQFRQIKMKWGCPKCRTEYVPDDIPADYLCFCKKVKNPTFQPLIVPHSCGETCGKSLKPHCGHDCLLLCHPGPCPPCPKTINSSCFCGCKSTVQRCSNKEWSCGSQCGKLLACGKHKCGELCHNGDCKPCPKKSMQKCVCQSEMKLRDCTTPVWQCEKVCKKKLSCNNHYCDERCHTGACGDCLLSQSRTCPCGKTNYQLPCTEDTPTCGDTCNKLLECGMHYCNQRCHKGSCMTCLEIVTKTCRCGNHSKEVQCKKPYLCESKCKQMKDCNKHPCNRKCCDGNCPPCEKPCGRTLSCKKHTCTSVCHRGPCYPCNLTESVYCRCSFTSVTVPCGRKSRTRPPKCMKLCTLPTECHHKTREPHRCHFGECPTCKQECKKERKKCSHNCPAPCHTSVLVKIEGQKASTPWEDRGPQVAKKAIPCPNCIVPVPVTCLGDHETANWPCHLAKPGSCGRNCGRNLPCGNHQCQKQCHPVAPSETSQVDINCEQCEQGCLKERPTECTHICPRPCHPGQCPPCKQLIRMKCHCGLSQKYIRCSEWTATTDREAILSCENQCPNNFACGHRCRANCHSGDCPNPEQCKKKMKAFCTCKRLKKEFSCESFRKGLAVVACDDVCQQKKLEEKELRNIENEERRIQEEKKNKIELEKYEKMFQGKKKTRDRRAVEEVVKKSFMETYWMGICGVVVCCVGLYLAMFSL